MFQEKVASELVDTFVQCFFVFVLILFVFLQFFVINKSVNLRRFTQPFMLVTFIYVLIQRI